MATPHCCGPAWYSPVRDVRALAARTVAAVARHGQSLSRELAQREAELDRRDRGLLRELSYGSLRWYPLLAALISRLLSKPLAAKDADLMALLVVGAYQLRHTRVPPHAALSATVTATRALGKGWASGLVNGVLRNVQRRGDQLISQLEPAARAAHPQWLWERIGQAWPAQAGTIFAANNDYPPMCLRVNCRQTTRDDYLGELTAAGIAASPCTLATSGIRLNEPVDVGVLPGFATGRVSVQDEAAQLAAGLLNLEAGQRVLDACCAPGGKTGHILETADLATLVALDSDPQRLERVTANLERLGGKAELRTGDAAQPDSWWDGQPFDRILLDAPCSGTGVIRRHPDIKLLRTPADVATLASQQQGLLKALWPLLAPGGELLYATCSILPEENSDTIVAFLAAQPDARELPLPPIGEPQAAGRQLLPAVGQADGFYYARLTKVG